ncbi:MAG: extracellular solute-binding protein [Treponema sp.]|jgi:putative aldouronate transport system substrate-binding protein|nr:extracellular solute-binding protein [Treponema sp.]
MKRFLLVSVTLIVAGSFVFAGGRQGSQSSSGGEVKLSAIAVTHDLTKDLNTMQWLNDLQKTANVSVVWEQISTGWNDKKAALFASGDIPDMIFNGTSDSDFAIYNGLFAELSSLIESHGPNIKKFFSEKPDARLMATQLDGKIYSLPQYNSTQTSIARVMFINKKWLDNVGKKVPATWDELRDVLRAFRDQDANGNGDRNDEVPMDFSYIDRNCPKYLLGALGLPFSNYTEAGYFVEDGKIKNYFFDERYKTLMIFLRDLYAEGLINKETVTQDYSQYQSFSRNDGKTSKVGFTWGYAASDRVGVLESEYIPLPPLKYSANQGTPVMYNNDTFRARYLGSRWALSAKSRNKEAAVRFIDQFLDPVISIQVLWGGMNDVDNCIRDNGDGSYTVLPPQDSQITPGTWKWTNSFHQNAPAYVADYFKLTPDAETLGTSVSRAPYEAQLDLYNQSNFYPEGLMRYSAEDNQTLALNETSLGTIKSRWAAWLVGEGSIDAEWNDYIKSAFDAGLNKNIEIRQKAFEAYLKSLN